jgi:hypothetical protein
MEALLYCAARVCSAPAFLGRKTGLKKYLTINEGQRIMNEGDFLSKESFPRTFSNNFCLEGK